MLVKLVPSTKLVNSNSNERDRGPFSLLPFPATCLLLSPLHIFADIELSVFATLRRGLNKATFA